MLPPGLAMYNRARKWSPEQDAILLTYYGILTRAKIAELTGKTVDAVTNRTTIMRRRGMIPPSNYNTRSKLPSRVTLGDKSYKAAQVKVGWKFEDERLQPWQ